MQNDLISVIVPVYNVEDYLRECLDSIISQTYTNLEIILVDDGSPDGSGTICDEYAKKDSRIKVIHQQNSGVSVARNTGLKAVTGDYIGFVDSDDYIEPNMYEELHRCLIENDADMSVCGIKQFGAKTKSDFYGNKCLNKSAFLKKLLDETVPSYLWNKLYKKHLFSGIVFPANLVYEDLRVLHIVTDKASTIGFTDKTFYNYRASDNTITSTRNLKNITDHINASHERSEKYKDTVYYVYAITGEFKCLRLIVSDMSVAKHDNILYKNLFKESKNLYKICKTEIKGLQKVITYIYLVSPKLYYGFKILSFKLHIFS